jgi:oligoendopeptidase F
MKALDKKFDKALVFIENHKIQQSVLAEKINLKSVSQLREKLLGTRYHKFSDEQKELILNYIMKIKQDAALVFKS